MSTFLLNILLALSWMALNGDFSFDNFVVGFILGFLFLWLGGSTIKRTVYTTRVIRIINFILFFLWELTKANIRMASAVIFPERYLRPAVVAIPLDIKSPSEITLLAHLITLTPGTLSLDVSSDRQTLYVHAMHIGDVNEFRQGIKDGFEKRVREVFL